MGIKATRNQAEKRRIGRAAASLVEDGAVVGLTGGSTATELARALADRRGITVVTNAINIAAELATRPQITLVVIGGVARPSYEMVGPAASYFRHATARLALVATPATIESGVYQNAFAMLGKDVQAVAIPELAGAIEFGKDDAAIERVVRDALAPISKDSFNVLILACTHYPLVFETFRRVVGDGGIH